MFAATIHSHTDCHSFATRMLLRIMAKSIHIKYLVSMAAIATGSSTHTTSFSNTTDAPTLSHKVTSIRIMK